MLIFGALQFCKEIITAHAPPKPPKPEIPPALLEQVVAVGKTREEIMKLLPNAAMLLAGAMQNLTAQPTTMETLERFGELRALILDLKTVRDEKSAQLAKASFSEDPQKRNRESIQRYVVVAEEFRDEMRGALINMLQGALKVVDTDPQFHRGVHGLLAQLGAQDQGSTSLRTENSRNIFRTGPDRLSP